MFYFVSFDGIPFACGPDQEFWCMAYDQKEPREYSMPPDGLIISKENFDKLVAEINA